MRTLAVKIAPLALLVGLMGGLAALGAGADDKEVVRTASVADPAGSAVLPLRPKGPRQTKKALMPLVDRAAEQFGVERQLVHAVVAAESAYDPHAVSRAGAIGLMQVMPATAADYGVRPASALFDPQVNLKTGTRHLKRLLGKYGNDYGRAIMAYNAGEGVVDRTNTNVTYIETLDYTAAVIRNYRRNGGKRPTEAAMKKVAMLRKLSVGGNGRRLMKKYLDLSIRYPSVTTALPTSYLDPGLHRVSPESRPMIVLEPPKRN